MPEPSTIGMRWASMGDVQSRNSVTSDHPPDVKTADTGDLVVVFLSGMAESQLRKPVGPTRTMGRNAAEFLDCTSPMEAHRIPMVDGSGMAGRLYRNGSRCNTCCGRNTASLFRSPVASI